MTDSELAAAIAEAVRPVWNSAQIRARIVGRMHLAYCDDLECWQVVTEGDEAFTRLVVPAEWAAAILMHELERIFVGWTGQEFPRPHNLDAARAAHAKLKELIRAQS